MGTERVQTSYNGAQEGAYASGVWGDAQTTIVGVDSDDYHFASLDHDYTNNNSTSSTDHAQFRQYSNTQGRWMSPDPYDGSYDYGDPQSFNRYSYVMNRPLSAIDPLGLERYCFPSGAMQPIGVSFPANGDGPPTINYYQPTICVDYDNRPPGIGHITTYDPAKYPAKPAARVATQPEVTPTADCSVYQKTGRLDLYAICRAFPTDKYSNYMRGCLQGQYSNGKYNDPWYSPIVIMPVFGPLSPIISPLYGPMTHASCAAQTGQSYMGGH